MGSWLGFLVAAFVFCGASCASTDGRVVARSEPNRPDWADGRVPKEPWDSVLLMHRKSDVSVLELGIKQAQAAAIQSAPALVEERVRSVFLDRAHVLFPALEWKDWEKAAGALFSGLVVSPEGLNPIPVRTYHEEIVREGEVGKRVSFDVYVLLSVSRLAFERWLGETARRFGASNNPKLAKVGQELLVEMNAPRAQD
jgi:hypothetical protein